MSQHVHETWMQKAIFLAERGRFTAAPNPVVGCVIVKNGHIIAEGFHAQAGQAHAEIMALHALKDPEDAKGADVYVTLEPCAHQGKTPPCVEALIQAGIKRLIVATRDPNVLVNGNGIQRLLQHGIEVIESVCETQARALNPGFFKRMQTGLPFVRCKSATSIDGRVSAPNGESQWITGEKAREDVHHLRARCQAIITGTGTLFADDPKLTVRLPQWDEHLQPWRLVLDSQGRAKAEWQFFKGKGRASAVVGMDAPLTHDVEQIRLPLNRDGGIDLYALLQWLSQHEINEVLVEAGSTLIGAFLNAGLLDIWHVYVAPKVLSERGQPLCVVPKIETMRDALQFSVESVTQIGDDVRIDLRPDF